MPEPDLDALHEEVGLSVGALLSDVNALADSQEWELVAVEARRFADEAQRLAHLDPDMRDVGLDRAKSVFRSDRYLMLWPDGGFIRSLTQRPNAVRKTRWARKSRPEVRLYDNRVEAYIDIDKED